MQMEIPQETVIYALAEAQRRKIPVILNPSPVPQVINPAIFMADILIPNQDETSWLAGEPIEDIHSAKIVGSALLAKGIQTAVITLGKHGAVAITSENVYQTAGYPTKVVDTTGAGDAFCGAFAVEYATSRDLKHALCFASAAGALACSQFGAQPSMPHRKDILALLQRHPEI